MTEPFFYRIDSLRQCIRNHQAQQQLTAELIPERTVIVPSVEEASCSYCTYRNDEARDHLQYKSGRTAKDKELVD